MISNEAVDAMISAAYMVAPNMQVTIAIGQIVRKMARAEETNVAIVLTLTFVIQDGILYGSWPKREDG
jgi:hypothetical protein